MLGGAPLEVDEQPHRPVEIFDVDGDVGERGEDVGMVAVDRASVLEKVDGADEVTSTST